MTSPLCIDWSREVVIVHETVRALMVGDIEAARAEVREFHAKVAGLGQEGDS